MQKLMIVTYTKLVAVARITRSYRLLDLAWQILSANHLLKSSTGRRTDATVLIVKAVQHPRTHSGRLAPPASRVAVVLINSAI